MKTLITLIFVLFIGMAAQAQETSKEVKVETIEMTITTTTSVVEKEVVKETTNEVARLYKRTNSRVKKALSFTTKRNRAKLA